MNGGPGFCFNALSEIPVAVSHWVVSK
jgi:hypothetical protein